MVALCPWLPCKEEEWLMVEMEMEMERATYKRTEENEKETEMNDPSPHFRPKLHSFFLSFLLFAFLSFLLCAVHSVPFRFFFF